MTDHEDCSPAMLFLTWRSIASFAAAMS